MKSKKLQLIAALATTSILMTACGSSVRADSKSTVTKSGFIIAEATKAPEEGMLNDDIEVKAGEDVDLGIRFVTDEAVTDDTETTDEVKEEAPTPVPVENKTPIVSEADDPELVEFATPTPTSTPTPTATPTPAFTFKEMNTIMYAADALTVRSLPNTNGKMIGSYGLNGEVRVTGKCYQTGWYRVNYFGKVGYVSNKYVYAQK